MLPKDITFAQWVKHPTTAILIFALGLAMTLLGLVVSGNNARVRDCQADRQLWKAAYDTMLKLKMGAEQQVFLERYYSTELKEKVDSLVQDKLQSKKRSKKNR